MVGGPAFVLNPDAVRQVGADAGADDAAGLHIAEPCLICSRSLLKADRSEGPSNREGLSDRVFPPDHIKTW